MQDRSGFRFNPLWLLDLAGLAGTVLFAVLALAPQALPALSSLPFAGELALAAAAVALTVRMVDAANRVRASRAAARTELHRRLAALDEALGDLRRSLARETARTYLDRRDAFAAGLEAVAPRLSSAALVLGEHALTLCERMTEGLADSIPRRAAIVSAAYRLGDEIGRAGRRGELDPYAAGDLRALIEDALGVMDEALYAEWNADHFGRLGAVQRHFARRIERREGETVRAIDREAAGLFDALVGHVRDKVALVEALAEWKAIHQQLGFALSGVRPPSRSAPSQGSTASRFALAPTAGERRPQAAPRLSPAAND